MPTLLTRVGPVAYSDDGTGPVLVLLHAALHDRHDFDAIVPSSLTAIGLSPSTGRDTAIRRHRRRRRARRSTPTFSKIWSPHWTSHRRSSSAVRSAGSPRAASLSPNPSGSPVWSSSTPAVSSADVCRTPTAGSSEHPL